MCHISRTYSTPPQSQLKKKFLCYCPFKICICVYPVGNILTCTALTPNLKDILHTPVSSLACTALTPTFCRHRPISTSSDPPWTTFLQPLLTIIRRSHFNEYQDLVCWWIGCQMLRFLVSPAREVLYVKKHPVPDFVLMAILYIKYSKNPPGWCRHLSWGFKNVWNKNK